MKILKFSAEYPCRVKGAPSYTEVRGRGLRKKGTHGHGKTT